MYCLKFHFPLRAASGLRVCAVPLKRTKIDKVEGRKRDCPATGRVGPTAAVVGYLH